MEHTLINVLTTAVGSRLEQVTTTRRNDQLVPNSDALLQRSNEIHVGYCWAWSGPSAVRGSGVTTEGEGKPEERATGSHSGCIRSLSRLRTLPVPVNRWSVHVERILPTGNDPGVVLGAVRY